MKINLPCTDANTICDKAQYEEASFWEKIKLHLHLFLCRACRKYTSQNQKLTEILNKAQVKTISQAEKLKLKERLQSELNK